MREPDLQSLVRAFGEAGIEFIVVGGVAAVLNGAPVNTFDIDVVHSREESNVARIMQVLDAADAIFRIQPERKIRPTASHLSGPGHLNLITRWGPVDVMGSIGQGMGYADLLPNTIEMEIAAGVSARVLDLPTLIALKEALGGEKDRAVLPQLRRTLEEKQRLEAQRRAGA